MEVQALAVAGCFQQSVLCHIILGRRNARNGFCILGRGGHCDHQGLHGLTQLRVPIPLLQMLSQAHGAGHAKGRHRERHCQNRSRNSHLLHNAHRTQIVSLFLLFALPSCLYKHLILKLLGCMDFLTQPSIFVKIRHEYAIPFSMNFWRGSGSPEPQNLILSGQSLRFGTLLRRKGEKQFSAFPAGG